MDVREFKKTFLGVTAKKKCDSCEFEELLMAARDGEMIPMPSKCVDCDYKACNINLAEAV